MAETAYTPDPRATRDAFLSRGYGCNCRGGGGVLTAELLAGLIHYWPLDEVTGVRADSIGGLGLTEFSGPVGSTAGKNGLAALGSDSNFNMLNASPFVFPAAFSVSLWMNLNTPVVSERYLFLTVDPDDIYLKGVNSIGQQIAVGSVNSGDLIFVSFGAIGQWHLLVLTFGAGVVKLSIDGASFVSSPISTPTGSTFYILGQGGGEFFDGAEDELAIWNRELSQAEAEALWNGGNGRFLA